MDYIEIIVNDLISHEKSWPFICPVDAIALGVPEYFNIIEQPMDLSTVLDKIYKKKYDNVDDFAYDVRLIWRNAEIFNPKDSDVHKFAQILKQEFENMYSLLTQNTKNSTENQAKITELQNMMEINNKEFEKEKNEYEALEIVKKEKDRENSIVPKIKSVEKMKKSISYEERMKLYDLYQTLDPTYMRGVNMIIEEEIPSEMRKDDDVIYLNMDKNGNYCS